MGLFSRKKENIIQQRPIPQFPQFPEMPRKREVSYEPAFAPQIVPAPPVEQHEAPVKPVPEPAWMDRRIAQPQEMRTVMSQPAPRVQEPVRADIPVREPLFKRPLENVPSRMMQEPSRLNQQSTRMELPRPLEVQEKPVFVKIERYREAMAEIDNLKQKLKETEYVLDKLEDIRTQEQVELSNCHNNVNKIKEKLLEIDKKLFEV